MQYTSKFQIWVGWTFSIFKSGRHWSLTIH